MVRDHRRVKRPLWRPSGADVTQEPGLSAPASTPAPPRPPKNPHPKNPPPLRELDDDFDFFQDEHFHDSSNSDDSDEPIIVAYPPELPDHTMAADFSEGSLETVVGNPQKELPGTKDQYISYQITTKVITPIYSSLYPNISSQQRI